LTGREHTDLTGKQSFWLTSGQDGVAFGLVDLPFPEAFVPRNGS
jgi:hypothetical protein